MGKNIAMTKSKPFALKIVKLYQQLQEEKREFVISKQILRSGTSIGANLAEAECAFSKRDFLYKQYNALKEASETRFWLELLRDSKFITEDEFAGIYNDCLELIRLLSASTKTLSSELKADA